jgi:hypothetical protein
VFGGQSARDTRMVRDELVDQVFAMFFGSSCVALFRSVESSVFSCKVFTDGAQVGGGQSVFWGVLLEVRVLFSDGLRRTCGQSA